MKKIIIFAALALLAPSVKAGEPLPPGLPGMKEDIAAPAAETEVRRPDSQKVMADLAADLHLSAKQEQRITAAVEKKIKEFDKLLKEYDKTSAEEKKWRYKSNDLKYEMAQINKDIPSAVRDFLDDDQRQTYDAVLAAREKPAAPEARIESVPAESAAGTPKPAKKRKLVRRKKVKAGGEPPDASSAAPAAAPAVSEDEPGQVMFDKEPAAAKAAAGPKKKRVLKKKAAVQAPAATDGDIMPNEPAGANPTGKDAPVEAAQDAGSYP